jgi:DNA invertase Pin-like site-specific DNA recombinase
VTARVRLERSERPGLREGGTRRETRGRKRTVDQTASVQRAVLLGRVSTDVRRVDQATGKVLREPQDPENQLVALREAARRLGWRVVEEVPLPGLSAWDETEAGVVQRAILAPFKAGRADVLMVWSLDRVVRGGIEAAFAFLRRLERDLGVGFWSLQEPFLNTATADREHRELMVALLSWVAHWESERRSQRLKAKAEAKRNQVAAGGGRARWGRGSLPSHEDEARVRKMVRSGKSYRAVRAATGWSLATVHRIIADGRREP